MAVLGRLLVSSAERLDLPDLLSLDSYAAGDWKFFLKGLVGDTKPYILKGFDIIDPGNAIGTQSCSIRVADSVVFYPGSNSGSFFHGLQEGHEQAAPLIPELRKNAVNYVYLTFSTFNTSADTRAFWDPDKDGGAGGEFTQDVNTESVLKIDINVSTGSFPANTIPIAKITVGPVVITAIEDARDLMFRLGNGGINPNPFNTYAWRTLPGSQYARQEPPTQMLAGGINPFQGADKNILTLKEWMDAIMSKLRELGGTTYWYDDTSSFSIITNFYDAVATAFKSKGKWVHDTVTPGLLTWTEDVQIKMTSDPRTYIVRQGSKTLADEQIMYIPMERNLLLNVTDENVSWINGQPYVNTIGGAVGLFANLSKGDYVKKANDTIDKWVRVEEFYDAVNLGGSTTTAANARSIRLGSAYLGTTGNEKGRYDKGVYLPADIVVSDRDDAAIANTGGNFHWLALRSDTIENIGNIATTSLSVAIDQHDGATARVTAVGHGLVDGDRITITNTTSFNGTYKVEVETSDIFYINIVGGPFADESGDAYYATVTTVARSTPYGFQEESANHGFNTDDTIIVGGTINYDGNFQINVRSSTQFTIPMSSAAAAETVGTATLAKVIVRTEGAVAQIIQGQVIDIGGSVADNIRQYVGMASLSETAPTYSVPVSYNTLDGMANYNGVVNENLTARISKLTSMMSDKAQDKTIKYLPSSGITTISNTQNGSAQELRFAPDGASLTLITPSSDGQAFVALPGSVTPVSLLQNQVAYVQIDRNNTSSPSIQVSSIVDCPLDENTFVIAVRINTPDIYIWEGSIIETGSIPSPGFAYTVANQDRNLKLVRGGMWNWDILNSELSWDADASIQVPGLPENRNNILAGSVVLSADGDVAYVDINRVSGVSDNLVINVNSISLLTLTTDRVIIARRVGDNVIVGTGTMLLVPGDYKALDADDKISRVEAVDVVSSVLPSGASVTVDGVILSNGNKVLFTDAALNGIYVVDGIGVAATWTKIDSFAGSNVPFEGSLVACQNGTSAFNTLWAYFNSSWKTLDNSQVTKEPTGFPNRTDTVLNFDDGTRTFSVAPVGTSFDIYQQGKVYRFESIQYVTIPNTEGLHYFYFNNGVLTTTQTFSDDIITQYVLAATVQWDATNSAHIMIGDERHGLTMDGVTHQYLHTAIGARYISGLSAGNFTLVGTGASDSDAQLSISSGTIRDEDIAISIVDSPAPINFFEQILDPVAEIPVYYRDGAAGYWRKDGATTFPVKQGAARIAYNDPAGPWTTPDTSADGNFVAMWIFATNNQEEPVVAVLGQREDVTLNDAQANNTYESISFGDLPSLEMKVLFRLIFESDSTYGNTAKARLADITDLRRAVDVALGTYAPGDHGLLTGLTDQDHPDYSIYVANPAAYVGGLKQIQLDENDDVQKALQSLDRFFAQMRMRPHDSDPNRVVISGADQTLTNGITLTQTIKNLMVAFDGAEIDFASGDVYESDGVTSLGLNFTPATIAAGQYRWYSVTAIASTVNADNTIGLQLVVLPASADGASPTLAPKAAYAKGMQLGQIYVQESGGGIASIAAANIKQLGTGGSGSGSGEGDANELLERLKDRLIEAPFEWVEPNIFLTDEQSKIDTATATFDVANTEYDFNAIGLNIMSINSLDPEFLTEEKDVDSVELMAFWNPDAIDPDAIYEVSRNGGVDWEVVTMERIGSTTETFRGILKFPQDTTYINLHEWPVADATTYRELNATTLQAIGQRFDVSAGQKEVLQRAILYINKVGSPTGYTYVQLVRDNGSGAPSTSTLDIIAQAQVLNSTLAAGDNAVTLTWGNQPVIAGSYHYVIATSDVYKSGFSAGVNSIRARVDSVGPIGPFGINELVSNVWTANAAQTLIHRIEGRPVDLRVSITCSVADVSLRGYGIYYGRQDAVTSGLKNREVRSFDGTIDNLNTFTLLNFLPDHDLLKVYHVETGQVYLYGINGFYLNGYQVVFPTNTFNGLGTVTLVFDQLVGTSFDNSDNNAALLAANFLGSTDPNIDRSQNGRGIFLRRPDGTLREIAIDNSDNIVVYSV